MDEKKKTDGDAAIFEKGPTIEGPDGPPTGDTHKLLGVSNNKPVDLAVKAKEKLERAFRDNAKAGIIEALKKIQSQVSHAADLNFTALRATSVQKHPDGQDLIIVVDAHIRAEYDGPLQTGG